MLYVVTATMPLQIPSSVRSRCTVIAPNAAWVELYIPNKKTRLNIGLSNAGAHRTPGRSRRASRPYMAQDSRRLAVFAAITPTSPIPSATATRLPTTPNVLTVAVTPVSQSNRCRPASTELPVQLTALRKKPSAANRKATTLASDKEGAIVKTCRTSGAAIRNSATPPSRPTHRLKSREVESSFPMLTLSSSARYCAKYLVLATWTVLNTERYPTRLTKSAWTPYAASPS